MILSHPVEFQSPNPLENQVAGQFKAARLIGGVFGFAFGGIGLTVLGFLWLTPFNQFDSPPLFFRLFGSFIALVFVVVGGTAFFGAISGRGLMAPGATLPQPRSQPAPRPAPTLDNSIPAGYACPHCGAPLTQQADVSPLGDVKCPFCHTWFNIHQPAS
jgi:hypothetical protein